jgi:hypothetical protein
MKYTKKVDELITLYALHPDDVFFAILVAGGAGRAESAYYAYHPAGRTSETALATLATSKAKEKPNINRLINALKGEALKQVKEDLNGEIEGMDITTKDGVIEFLQRRVKSTIGKEQLETVKLIADLMRMKQEENKEEEERVHIYLPQSCANCKYKSAFGKEQLKQ